MLQWDWNSAEVIVREVGWVRLVQGAGNSVRLLTNAFRPPAEVSALTMTLRLLRPLAVPRE